MPRWSASGRKGGYEDRDGPQAMRYPRNYFPVKRCFHKRLHPGAQPAAFAASHAAGARRGNGPDWDGGKTQRKKEAQQ